MCRHRVLLILEYISTHGTPECDVGRMSARECRGRLSVCEQPCMYIMHKPACVGSTPGERGNYSWLSMVYNVVNLGFTAR